MAGQLTKPGPKPGYKQTAEHIAKRIKRGSAHPNWKGDDVTPRSGRSRALRKYAPSTCERCTGEKAERHHIDGDTANNEPTNIAMLCRRCHMREHARLGTYKGIDRPRGKDGRYVGSA